MIPILSILFAVTVSVATLGAAASKLIHPSDPLIWYHGRWDSGRGTWWTGTGFTLHTKNLTSFSVQLGPNTTQPFVSVGISVNYGQFIQFNLTSGTNAIPLPSTFNSANAKHGSNSRSVIRLTVQGWEKNNLYLDQIILNSGASLLAYKPSKLNFQFISDSTGAGHMIAQGINGAWPFLTAELFKSEQQINAISGICMTEAPCFNGVHGLTTQFFKTEDAGYYTNPNHNYTTRWDFHRDYRPTHVFLVAGANDNAFNITGVNLTSPYVDFIGKIRHLYPTQPIFVFGSSIPNDYTQIDPNGYGLYIEGVYETVLARNAMGDKKVYFVDTKRWVHVEDLISLTNTHLNPLGHVKLAEKLVAWLKTWGVEPQVEWRTEVN